MFTVTLEKQSHTFRQILELLFPKTKYVGHRVKGIDLTYGTGALWWNILDEPCPCCNDFHFEITKCDADPQWMHEAEIFQNLYRNCLIKYEKQKRFLKIQDLSQRLDAIRKKAEQKAREITDKACDKSVIQKNIFSDSYSGLGKHKFGAFDPPYLYGDRQAFDYPSGGVQGVIEKFNSSHITPMQLQGPRSWGANGLHKFVGNRSIEEFEQRVRRLNEIAPDVLESNGLLVVKVMDPRHDGRLVKNHITIDNILTNKAVNPKAHFQTEDLGPYIRQGATTFTTESHFQNLHGFWMVYKLVE